MRFTPLPIFFEAPLISPSQTPSLPLVSASRLSDLPSKWSSRNLFARLTWKKLCGRGTSCFLAAEEPRLINGQTIVDVWELAAWDAKRGWQDAGREVEADGAGAGEGARREGWTIEQARITRNDPRLNNML